MDSLSWTPRQHILVRVLERLAQSKELQPGSVTRRHLKELADVSELKSDFAAHPEVQPLLRRIGLTRRTVAASPGPSASNDSEKQFGAGFNEQETLERRFLQALFREEADKWQHEHDVLEAQSDERAKQASKGGVAKREKYARAKTELQRIWSRGNHMTRGNCAFREHKALGITESTAIKALTGTPDPDPWPAKARRR